MTDEGKAAAYELGRADEARVQRERIAALEARVQRLQQERNAAVALLERMVSYSYASTPDAVGFLARWAADVREYLANLTATSKQTDVH